MEFDKVVKKRASVRKYAPKKADIMQVMDAIEAANMAPSPGNLQILKYLIVEDGEKIAKLAEACQQRFVAEAGFVVVVCSNKENVEKAYDKRAEKYVKHHVGAAVENFLLKVTEMGLASCWVGAFSDMTIKTLLNIPDDIDVEVVLPVAYEFRGARTLQKKKPSLNFRVNYEKWGNKWKKPFRSAHPG